MAIAHGLHPFDFSGWLLRANVFPRDFGTPAKPDRGVVVRVIDTESAAPVRSYRLREDLLEPLDVAELTWPELDRAVAEALELGKPEEPTS